MEEQVTFKQLGIHKDFIKSIEELGIKTPTQIQADVIPRLLQDPRDLVGQAQTGTGKTAAYGLPLLQRVDASKPYIQGLILCPTRELGQQVAKQLFKFTKYSDKIFTEAVYGGEKIDIQISRLRRTTHIIVATPGRLIDLIRRREIDIREVKTVILDEADEMLSMGFKDQLNEVLGHVSKAECKWLFSATMPEGINTIVNQHLAVDAHRIEVASRDVINRGIKHQYVICEEPDKLFVLEQFLKSQKGERGVVFCKTKSATQTLAKQLQAKNVGADGIHGDLKQKERDKVMRAFKNGSLDILVATDLAARGMDIANLAFVAHYQLPDQDEYYTHRSGRTARAGQEGVSLAIVTTKEMKQLRFFEKKLGIVFDHIKRTR